jgi:peptide/nickel transport system substrate-binding protein
MRKSGLLAVLVVLSVLVMFVNVSGEDPQYGGTLRVAVDRGLVTISPIMHISGVDWMATNWMYNNLTKLDENRKVVGDLALSWEPNENATEWIFYLRKGVKFHSGKELTAEDVVATIRAVKDPEVAAPYGAEIGPIQSVEAVDEYSVKFILDMPYADFPNSLTHPCARIISKEAFEGDIDVLATREFGSGPFILKEFVPGDHIVVERFNDYYKEGLPYLDRVEAKVFPDTTTEMTALFNKEIDLMWEVPPELYPRISTTSGIDGLAVAGGTLSNVIMPSNKPPFDDNRVREALKYTVDRSLMLAAVLQGRGEIGHDCPISSAYDFYVELPTREQDIDKARELLKEAGYPNGLSFKLYVANRPPIREQIAVVLKEMARPAGFDIDVEVISYDRYLAQVWNKGVAYVGFYTTRPTADAILMKLFHSEFGIDEGRWADSHQDAIRILEEARSVTDRGRREELYAQFLQISQNEGPFIVPVFRQELSAKWNYVRNYKLNPSAFEMELEDVWLLR